MDIAGAAFATKSSATYVVRRGGNRYDEAWLAATSTPGFEWTRRPIVFNAFLETLAIYNAPVTGHWYRWIGHVKREFHSAFRALCPDIPGFTRPGRKTRQDTLPRTYEEFRETIGRRAVVRNANTLFRQDPGDPPTMGMYCALYPPPAAP